MRAKAIFDSVERAGAADRQIHRFHRRKYARSMAPDPIQDPIKRPPTVLIRKALQNDIILRVKEHRGGARLLPSLRFLAYFYRINGFPASPSFSRGEKLVPSQRPWLRKHLFCFQKAVDATVVDGDETRVWLSPTVVVVVVCYKSSSTVFPRDAAMHIAYFAWSRSKVQRKGRKKDREQVASTVSRSRTRLIAREKEISSTAASVCRTAGNALGKLNSGEWNSLLCHATSASNEVRERDARRSQLFRPTGTGLVANIRYMRTRRHNQETLMWTTI